MVGRRILAVAAVATAVLMFASACSRPGQPPGSSGPPLEPEPDAQDITGVVLTDTAQSCADYEGPYTAHSTDVVTGTDHTAVLNVEVDAGLCTFVTNQIPNHDAGASSHWPGIILPNTDYLQVTAAPELAAQPSPLGMGAIAMMLNGVKWEAFPAACYGVGPEPDGLEAIGCGPDQIDNPWRYDIGSPLNDFGFDDFMAHIQPGGMYHYHSTPSVLYDIDCDGNDPSPVIGFAADGFPVHGPCFDDNGTVRPAQSSHAVKSGPRQPVAGYTTPLAVGNVAGTDYDGQFIGDYGYVPGSGDLDECNGMTVDGSYGYYITGEYPYVVGCYSGEPFPSFG